MANPIKLFKILAQATFCVFILPVLYLLEPFVRLRFGHLHNQRIGHLVLNPHLFIGAQQITGRPDRTLYFFFVWDPANQQYLDMLKRVLPIYQNRSAARLFYLFLPVIKHTRFHEPFSMHEPWRRYHIINKCEPYHEFIPDEEKRGSSLLQDMGLTKKDWFVLFNSRDLKYITTWRPQKAEFFQENTEYRSCDIKNFMLAAEFITSLGGYAIRVGSVVSEPLPETDNPKIIDYATQFRSDFGDIYLSAKCRAFVSPASGICEPAGVFGNPVTMVNCSPFHRPYRTHDQYIPKKIFSKKLNRLLTFPEAYDLGFFNEEENYFLGSLCEREHCELVQNSPEEIRDAAADILDARNGVTPSPGARELQNYYLNKFHTINGHIYEGAAISPSFAVRHRDLIIGA